MNASRSLFAVACFNLVGLFGLHAEYPAGDRIPFACDRHWVVASPTSVATATNILDKLRSTRVPGAGGVIREWTIKRVRTNLVEIIGVVIDDNVGSPQGGIPMFIGNHEVTNGLRWVTTTGTNGVFRIQASVETFTEITNALPKGAFIIPWADSNRPQAQPTNEDLIRERRYLYIGRDGIDLYRYRIPYEEANQKGEVTQKIR